jgi:hypothetical protein
MVPVDSENSTHMPARPAGNCFPGLAQQRDREKALRKVAKLRKKASAEIERLIGFLDASDDYALELEDQADAEPSLGWPDGRNNANHGGSADLEADDDDDEPSLGAIERSSSAYGFRPRSHRGSIALGE